MVGSLARIWSSLRGAGAVEREVRDEMEAHIAFLTDDNLAAGMSPGEARRRAESKFGQVERLVREGADLKRNRDNPLGRFPNRPEPIPGRSLMNDLLSDIRFALRTMAKSPIFVFVAALSLAVGIGFNTTMFTIIDTVMFKPMPVANPDTLVRVMTSAAGPAALGLMTQGDAVGSIHMSYPDFEDVRDSVRALEGVALFRTEMAPFNNDGAVEFLFGESVSPNLFSLLGLPPVLGRSFTAEEAEFGKHRVVMLGENFWRTRFGGREDVLGEEILLAGEPYVVVGVVPRSYSGGLPPLETSFWAPIAATLELGPDTGMRNVLERRGSHSMYMFGRLAAGSTLDQVNAELTALAQALATEYPETNSKIGFRAALASSVRFDPGVDAMMLPAAGVLMVLVGLILLLACANVANMMLARGSARGQEIGVRMALGAGRGRLVRQLLTESLVLSVIGGLGAIVVARLAIQLLLAVQPPIMVPMQLNIDIGSRVWLFTGIVALFTGLGFGLIPALRSTRADLSQALRGDDVAASQRQHGTRLRNTLVIAQVTISLVLLVSASLMVRSLRNAQSIDPGIATEALLLVNPGLPMQGYSVADAYAMNTAALDRIAALPGVEAVAYAERVPLESTMVIDRDVYPEGVMLEPDGEPYSTMSSAVSAEYFEVMGIGIARGRGFLPSDGVGGQRVAVINAVMAEDLWPGENPIGKRVALGSADRPLTEIVGIHAPHKVSTLGEDPTPNLYVPYEQNHGTGFGTLVARSAGEAGAIMAAMRQVFAELDPGLAVLEAKTIRQHLSLSLFPVRFSAAALGLLGLIGALLAAVGVYGVVAFSVARRTREIGVRMAIGADRPNVVGMVVRQGMRLIVAGTIVGVVVSLAFTRVLGALLYGVSATDVIAYLAGGLALVAVGAIANLMPALRASRVDPVLALRSE